MHYWKSIPISKNSLFSEWKSFWEWDWPVYRAAVPCLSFLLNPDIFFYCTGNIEDDYSRRVPFSWTRFWCRLAGHPHGVQWYTYSGSEPDMHCKYCEDDLG